MKISDTPSPFFKTTLQFYKPLPFYGKNLNPLPPPPLLLNFRKRKPISLHKGGGGFQLCMAKYPT